MPPGSGNKEVARFLLENGAYFSSYTLMDHGKFTQELLRERLVEDRDTLGDGRVQQVSLFICLLSLTLKNTPLVKSHNFYSHLLWIYLQSEFSVFSERFQKGLLCLAHLYFFCEYNGSCTASVKSIKILKKLIIL